MILLIDNYDSFSYNLYQLIGSVYPDIRVIRNDDCTVEEIEAGGSGRLPNARYVSDHLALDCEFVFANSF